MNNTNINRYAHTNEAHSTFSMCVVRGEKKIVENIHENTHFQSGIGEPKTAFGN
jgi:hypothetical protein